MKTSRITALAVATLLTCGSFARAQTSVHVDALALTAERQARQVLFQASSLHACGPAAQELTNDAVRMVRLARHIHDFAHVDHRVEYGRRGHFAARTDYQAHLNRDVVELDRLVHHMQDLVARMTAANQVHRPVAYGRPGNGQVAVSVGRFFSLNISPSGAGCAQHGGGFRAPSTLDRVAISLAELSTTVHHLLDDTQVVCVRRR